MGLARDVRLERQPAETRRHAAIATPKIALRIRTQDTVAQMETCVARNPAEVDAVQIVAHLERVVLTGQVGSVAPPARDADPSAVVLQKYVTIMCVNQ
jgi:hypothetical protein